MEAASNPEYLKKYKINAILTVASGTGLNYGPSSGFVHEIVLAEDHP